jgi:hypothetical protein
VRVCSVCSVDLGSQPGGALCLRTAERERRCRHRPITERCGAAPAPPGNPGNPGVAACMIIASLLRMGVPVAFRYNLQPPSQAHASRLFSLSNRSASLTCGLRARELVNEPSINTLTAGRADFLLTSGLRFRPTNYASICTCSHITPAFSCQGRS